MVVRQDHRCGIAGERNLHDLAGVDTRLRERATEQLDELDQAILRVDQECDEDFVLELGELGTQIVAYDVRRRHRRAPPDPPADDLACSFEDLVARCQPVLA